MVRLLSNFFFIILITFATACNAISSESSLWDKMISEFRLPPIYEHPLINKYINRYIKQKQHILQITNQAVPYLYYVVNALEQRNMPLELALLPMIESGYKPYAISNKGAAGIWQLSPIIGKTFGLTKNVWQDQRKDIIASTNAALSHLQFLYKEFNQDWLLALAAYNAGAGRIKQAILKNKKNNKNYDFWSLQLPNETRQFVPKFLALAKLIKNSKNFGINLPIIKNKPYFTKVFLNENCLELKKISQLIQVDINELKSLNPSFHANTSKQILIPIDKLSTLKVLTRFKVFQAVS